MNAAIWAIVGAAVVAAFGDAIRQEATGWVGLIPSGLLALAARRVPIDYREAMLEDWRRELDAVRQSYSGRPITAWIRCTTWAASMIEGGRSHADQVGFARAVELKVSRTYGWTLQRGVRDMSFYGTPYRIVATTGLHDMLVEDRDHNLWIFESVNVGIPTTTAGLTGGLLPDGIGNMTGGPIPVTLASLPPALGRSRILITETVDGLRVSSHLG